MKAAEAEKLVDEAARILANAMRVATVVIPAEYADARVFDSQVVHVMIHRDELEFRAMQRVSPDSHIGGWAHRFLLREEEACVAHIPLEEIAMVARVDGKQYVRAVSWTKPPPLSVVAGGRG